MDRPDIEEGYEFLCDRCPHSKECEYAFDLYNTVKIGEEDWCLADK